MRRILERPDARAQLARSALKSGSLVLIGLCAAILALQGVAGLGAAFALKTVAAYLAGFALLHAGLGAHLPQTRFGAANQVTLVRAALVALLFGLVGEGDAAVLAWMAVSLALLAASLDGLDGWLARRHGSSSAFGARFDMETDALLILVLSLLAWQLGKAGPWILLAGLMRYAFVAAGYRLPWLRRSLPPSKRRQTVCVIQIFSLILCIAPFVPPPWSQLIAATGLLLLVWSFLVDILWLARRASTATKESLA